VLPQRFDKGNVKLHRPVTGLTATAVLATVGAFLLWNRYVIQDTGQIAVEVVLDLEGAWPKSASSRLGSAE
jgi:hypothetical protein